MSKCLHLLICLLLPLACSSELLAKECERVILYVIDGLHWQAPAQLDMPVFNALVKEGTYIEKSHMLIPHHPTVGEYGAHYSCSFPNPVLHEGTFFLDPGNKMIQETVGKPSALIVNSTAYRSIGRGFTHCTMVNSLSDEEVVEKAIALLGSDAEVGFLRIHLQSPGSKGTEIALRSEGLPYSRNIFGPGSPYVAAVEGADVQLGRLLDYLRDSGKWEGTVLIVTSDHGQSRVGWHPVLDEDSWTTPLLFVGKNIAQGRILPDFDHVDLAPTIAWLLGGEAPTSNGGSGKAVREIAEGRQAPEESGPARSLTIDNQIKEYEILLARMTLAAREDSHLANIISSLTNQNLTPEPFYDKDRIMDWHKSGDVGHLIAANEAVLEKMRKALEDQEARAARLKDKRISQAAFEKMFGELAVLDPATVATVLGDVAGKRHYFDKDGDGKPEEVWFVDVDPRHSPGKRPVLVKVVDLTGTLAVGREPRKCGAFWVADQQADGFVDSIILYADDDSDGDLDHMEWYNYGHRTWRIPFDGLRLLYVTDDGDDNLLDYDIDYKYYQIPCQNHSHFGGAETFIALYLDEDGKRWIPYFENPFIFFDDDQDGITEEVIRVEGHKNILRTIRWSFNASPTDSKPRDYDVSLSAVASGWNEEDNMTSPFDARIPESVSRTIHIQGLPASPILKRESARSYLKDQVWAREMLTWNENNLNIEFETPENTIERWEGVLNPRCDIDGGYMPAVGAPDCGVFNKRFELLLRPTAPSSYYYSPADARIHLKGADKVWLDVDYDYDGSADMGYLWKDEDGDGYVDTLLIDMDMDGVPEDRIPLHPAGRRPVDWTFVSIRSLMSPVYAHEPERKFGLITSLREAYRQTKGAEPEDPVWDLVNRRFRGIPFPAEVSDRLLQSDKSLLYYLGLVQDRHIWMLKQAGFADGRFWSKFDKARSRGDTFGMATMLRKRLAGHRPDETWTSWIKHLRKVSKPRVAWNNTWLPPNWGWESDKAAFRFYNGHFDLFGKREWLDTLIMPDMPRPTDTGADNYHEDRGGWGMDILHVGNTSGCGGLILYVNGEAFPVRRSSPTGLPSFTGAVLKQTADTLVLQFTASGVGPRESPFTVTVQPAVFAGMKHSSIAVTVEGGKADDRVELGIGMVRLPDETFLSEPQSGMIASWGFQEPSIGFIGMGVLFDPSLFLRADESEEEHRVVLRCTRGVPLNYSIQGDWLRGHLFPVYPSAKDWFDTLKKTKSAHDQ